MKTCLKNNQGGFSLLEILIAVAILATSIVALLSAQGTSFLSSERAQTLTIATFLARQKMVEIEVELEKDLEKNKFPESEEEKTGSFDEPFDDYRWKYTVKKVEIPVMDAGSEEAKNAMVGSYMQNVVEQISKSVREIQLTILWGDKEVAEKDQQQFSVTTHVVNLTK